MKSQPWFHSWYGDFLALHFIPLLFIVLASFNLPPFNNESLIKSFIFAVLVIDWSHGFAQWFRLYGNPLETQKNKITYSFLFIIFLFIGGLFIHFDQGLHFETFLIYFALYHFVRQSFGFVRIYGHADGLKNDLEKKFETALIYSSMATPILYWHVSFPDDGHYWAQFFIESPFFKPASIIALIIYVVSLSGYLFTEVKRSRARNFINIPKNLSIFTTAVAWGSVTWLDSSRDLINFTVLLTHNIGYISFVWLVGRRDAKFREGPTKWFSWWSVPGAVCYFLVIIVVSQFFKTVYIGATRGEASNFIFGDLFFGIPQMSGWWHSFGLGAFLAIQGFHYYIDSVLWVKEKDVIYMAKKK